jgi:single-strand DNA-binding protein
MAFSKVMIIGNLGRDPEMRYTPNGRQVTEFSVAVTHRGRDAATNEWADLGTDWFRVTVWGDRAERAAEEFRKGNRVFVEGRFKTREYDAKDGSKRTSLEITADNVIALERKSRDDDGDFGSSGPASSPRPAGAGAPSSAGGPAPAGAPRGGGGGYDDGGGDLDDLPF